MGKKKLPVFLDVCVMQLPSVRMVFELFHDKAPFSAENFRVLCTGEAGLSPKTKKDLWFIDRSLHLKKGGSYVKGGVLGRRTREGGEDALGRSLPMESNDLKHDRAGLLSIPKGDGSQFLITLEANHNLDSSHVVIGKLVKGYGGLWWIRDLGYDGASIEYCGEHESDDLPYVVIWKHYLSDPVDEVHFQIKGSVSEPTNHNSSPQRARKMKKNRTDEDHLPKRKREGKE